jgi:hypothetical protein
MLTSTMTTAESFDAKDKRQFQRERIIIPPRLSRLRCAAPGGENATLGDRRSLAPPRSRAVFAEDGKGNVKHQ